VKIENRVSRISKITEAARQGLFEANFNYHDEVEEAEQNTLPDGADIETAEGNVIPIRWPDVRTTDMFPRPPV